LSVGFQISSPQKPLTNWRGKDRHVSRSKSSSPWKPLTDWRGEDSIISRVKIQLTMGATHGLGNRGQAWSRRVEIQLTTEATHPLERPRTGVVSRVKIQLTKEATHWLESQGQVLSAGSKSCSPWKPLTFWIGENMCHQQGPNPAHHRSHSQTGESRTGIVSRVKIQLTIETTHILESQGQASSAGSKSGSPWKPLTSWRAKDRCR